MDWWGILESAGCKEDSAKSQGWHRAGLAPALVNVVSAKFRARYDTKEEVMPMVGEQAWEAWAFNTGDDLFTATWDLDFPPSAAFIKVFQGHYFEFDDQGAVDIGLINIRRRKPDNSDETITFPDIDAFDHVYTQFDPKMTHVTFGIKVSNCSASLVWTLGFWA